MVEFSGCKVPVGLLDQLRAATDRGDQAAAREIGVGYAAALCERLLAEGVPGLHFARSTTPARPSSSTPRWPGHLERQQGPHHRVGGLAAGEAEAGQQVGEPDSGEPPSRGVRVAVDSAAVHYVAVVGNRPSGGLRPMPAPW